MLEALQLNMAVNRLTKHLNVNASRLLEEHQVKYENKTKHAGRRIRLTYMVIEAPMVEVIRVKRDACNGRDGVLRGTLSTVATVATVAEKKNMRWCFATSYFPSAPYFRAYHVNIKE